MRVSREFCCFWWTKEFLYSVLFNFLWKQNPGLDSVDKENVLKFIIICNLKWKTFNTLSCFPRSCSEARCVSSLSVYWRRLWGVSAEAPGPAGKPQHILFIFNQTCHQRKINFVFLPAMGRRGGDQRAGCHLQVRRIFYSFLNTQHDFHRIK